MYSPRWFLAIAILVLLMITTPPVLAYGAGPIVPGDHRALDVEGRFYGDGGGIPVPVPDAVAKQKSIGYTPESYTRPDRSLIKNELPQVGVFFFHGHGYPGQMQTAEHRDAHPDEYYCARGSPDGYNIDDLGSLSHLKLALLEGCNTGTFSPVYGNLVESIYNKEGECAIGYTHEIFGPGDVAYSQTFWSEVTSGASYIDSHDKAVQFVYDKYGQEKDADGRPGQCYKYCNGTCCLNQMHRNGCLGGLTAQPEVIDYEQGRVMAENAARDYNPASFQNSATRETIFGSDIVERSENDREFNYNWEEHFYYPDKFTEPHLDIRGWNNTRITIYSRTGEMGRWGSSIGFLDPTLSLTPRLTEDQAREIAKTFAAKQFRFTELGITPDASDWKTDGLAVYGLDGAQSLYWDFEVEHRKSPDSYLMGGGIRIDANTGEFLGSSEIV